MSDGHPRRYAVRVDDHIRHNSIKGEREVFLAKHHPTGPFLPMPRSKFIPNLWYFNLSNLNFGHSKSRAILPNHNSLDESSFPSFQPYGDIFRLNNLSGLMFITISQFKMTDNNISLIDMLSQLRQSVDVNTRT